MDVIAHMHKIVDAIARSAKDAEAWRRHIHRNPEILFELPETATFVTERLQGFGCDEIHTGIATSGIVAVIRGSRGAGKGLALRCDMDALPILEASGKDYASASPGRMHACGHDGHTAIMLGVAKVLTAHRDFAGTVILIFQPAEEGGGGGRVMLEEGIFEKFGVDEVYALHNLPGLPVGSFAIRSGPIMASSDRFRITVFGKGGHAALPHLACDPVVVAANLVGTLQQIASRNVDPIDAIALSITHLAAGSPNALNVIPDSATVAGTLRTLRTETRSVVLKRMEVVTVAMCQAAGAEGRLELFEGYPTTINDARATALAVEAARNVAGRDAVDADCPPIMGAEDFSFMLRERPGAMIWLGNGPSASLHNAAYDFDDEAIAHGIAYWLALVDRILGRRHSDLDPS